MATPGPRDARYVIDPHLETVIFQVVRESDGEVVFQSPDEAALRRRSHARQLEEAAAEGARFSRSF